MLRLLLCIVICVAPPCLRASSGADIKLLSSNAVQQAYGKLIPEFEKATGHRVEVLWVGTPDAKRRVADGEIADLVIVTGEDVDSMTRAGQLAPGSRVDLVKSIIGIAVRAGLPKPDVSSGAKLRAVLLNAPSIILSSGPSSVYLLDLWEKEQILSALRPKIKRLAPGQSVGEALARGEGDLGFTQVSELLHIKGINYVGPLSSDVQRVTIYSAGTLSSAPQPEAAKELLRFLRRAEHSSVLKQTGLEAVP
jgi:molybdate transport system substrate-binding protein